MKEEPLGCFLLRAISLRRLEANFHFVRIHCSPPISEKRRRNDFDFQNKKSLKLSLKFNFDNGLKFILPSLCWAPLRT